MLFGLVLAVVGSAVHCMIGSVGAGILLQFLASGISGVVLGCVLSTRVPAQNLKGVLPTVAIRASSQLMWSSARAYAAKNLATPTMLDLNRRENLWKEWRATDSLEPPRAKSP